METLFKTIVEEAMILETSDIHISFKQFKWCIYYRIKHVLIFKVGLEHEVGDQLINFIKYKAGLNMSLYFKPQTGQIEYAFKNKLIYLRISSVPSKPYESMVIRIMNNHKQVAISKLSCFKDPLQYFNQLITKRQGLFITTGTTGSGKTTTLYALLDGIYQQSNKNIITIEDPIEIVQPQYTQLQINEYSGVDFYSCLKQILRHDPDVIMIGEIRDELTAKIAVRSALTGHLVLATMHANNALSSIQRLKDLGVRTEDMRASLIGISHQILCYSDCYDKPFCVYEILDKAALMHYFNGEKVYYKTINHYLKDAIKHNIITSAHAGHYYNEF